MSAMENMVRTVLSAMDIDVEKMKAEVTGRIAAFEKNVETLNDTLIKLHTRSADIESKLDLLIAFHNLKPTAKTNGAANVNDTGESLPAP